MKRQINLRLALIALIAVVATTVSVTLVYYNLFQNQVKNDLGVNLQLLRDTGMFQQVYAQADGNRECINTEVLNTLQQNNLRVTWIDADGTVLYDNELEASDMENHLNRPEIQAALTNGSGQCVRESNSLNTNTFYYATRLQNGTFLRVATRVQSIASVFFAVTPVILALIVLIFALCILLGHYLTARLLKPMEAMAEHLDDQLEPPAYKELEPFADKIRSQHEKILEAATSRQDFTANVSHELKTPLTAISGYAELIENHMVDTDRQSYIAQQIRHNSDRLLSLINDIIRLSELDHKELPRHFETVDLQNVAADVCGNLRASAEQHSVNLRCTGNSVLVSADRDLMKELIENLVQNAIRYNKENGTVTVNTATENGHPVLRVADTGIGIPKDQQSRVFERFYRVDKSRSRETGGTGLGLAIVKHIAELHHARITLDSEEGKGTLICVTF